MKQARRILFSLFALAFIVAMSTVVVNNYSFIFSKKIRGEVVAIDRVTQPLAIIGSQTTAAQTYSFAIALRTTDGKIFTASSEDRQWAIVQKGNCIEARFYPYPPWDLEKSGTYHGARLEELYNDCSLVNAVKSDK